MNNQDYAVPDHLEVLIFPDCSKEENQNIEQHLIAINKHIENLSKDYLWHVDCLRFNESNINLKADSFSYKKESLPPFLYSNTISFGENIEDEWFIVHILHQLTKLMKGLIVRIWDADGEFLLIEAAEHLPNWCNPETCFERVFLYNGELHILKQDSNTSDMAQLLESMRCNPSKTLASCDVQNDILKRIRGYPEILKDQVHYAHAYIPADLARALKSKPNLISLITRAFCHRDPLDMKTVKNFPHFSSSPRVLQRVKFTKCLYAMIMSSHFSHPNIPVASSPLYKTNSLGVKLTCGAEIYLAQSQHKKNTLGKQWFQYLENLNKKGYFKDLLEGSKEYKELEEMAKEFYLKNQCEDPREGLSKEHDLQDIIYKSKNVDINQEPLLPADDDHWMEINSEDLDKILNEKFALKTPSQPVPKKNSNNPISSAITKFLQHSSGLEGAEFPNLNENSDTESDDSEAPSKSANNRRKENSDENDRGTDENVNFNFEEFSSAVSKLLERLDESDEELIGSEDDSSDISGSDSDDYMKAMEEELSHTTIAKSFVTKEDESVDIDMNALQNVIQSYEAQIGMPGPASNVLQPMGINMRSILENRPKENN